MNLNDSISLYAGEEDVEMEGKPIRPVSRQKRIVKRGTQFCVESDGVDKNFGCWPSREQADAVAAGKSFIEPLMKAAKWKHPSEHKPNGDITHASYIDSRWSIDHDTGDVIPPRDPRVEKERKFHRKNVEKANKTFVGGVVEAAGIGFGGPPVSRGTNVAVKKPKAKAPSGKMGHQLTTPSMTKGVGRNHRLPNPSFEAGGPGSGRHPEGKSSKKDKLVWECKNCGTGMYRKDIRRAKQSEKYCKECGSERADTIRGYADMGEPMAGALQHAHLDTNLWFHPPSLKNPQRIPTDDPKEKNDRFLDVTKRKEAHKDRMKILKRSSPGGNPPMIPARTTFLSPHQAVYQPGMFASWQGRRRRRAGGGMFRAFGAAKI